MLKSRPSRRNNRLSVWKNQIHLWSCSISSLTASKRTLPCQKICLWGGRNPTPLTRQRYPCFFRVQRLWAYSVYTASLFYCIGDCILPVPGRPARGKANKDSCGYKVHFAGRTARALPSACIPSNKEDSICACLWLG